MLPTVNVEPLSEQRPKSVTLNATVNPEGKPVGSCVFEYVIASEYEAGAANPYAKGTKVPCQPNSLGEESKPVPVKAELGGLTPEVAYDYRLVAENAGGQNPSPNQEFFTGTGRG